MTKDIRDFVNQWLEKAEHDLAAANALMEVRPLILDTACFHCQQAVEKLFKAFLISKGTEIILTHDVVLLQKKCVDLDNDFASIDLKDLNDFAVDVRYPADVLMPSMTETKEYFEIAGKLKELVIEKI